MLEKPQTSNLKPQDRKELAWLIENRQRELYGQARPDDERVNRPEAEQRKALAKLLVDGVFEKLARLGVTIKHRRGPNPIILEPEGFLYHHCDA